MRMISIAVLGAALMGCGGKVDSASVDRPGATTVVGSCTYGELGRVPGAPFGVASIGSKVFVVASQFVNGGAGNSEGFLYAIGEDGGATLLDQSTSPNLTAFGDQAAFLEIEDTNTGLVGTSLQSSDANGNITALDLVGDQTQFVDMSSIAFDGQKGLAWYRWPTLVTPGARALPTIASRPAAGQPITTATIDPAVHDLGAFVTDGTHDYATFGTKEDGYVIGVLPVNADPKVVLVPLWAHPLAVDAVDDTMLLYTAAGATPDTVTYWEVPKAGGESLMVADGLSRATAPLLHDHDIYWIDITSGPTSTVWELSEIENSTAKAMVTTPRPIFAIAADSCGIVYTTMDDALQNGIVTRVAF